MDGVDGHDDRWARKGKPSVLERNLVAGVTPHGSVITVTARHGVTSDPVSGHLAKVSFRFGRWTDAFCTVTADK